VFRQIKRWLYTVVGVLVIAAYGHAAFRGLELPLTKKGVVQQGMRGAQGGSRTFWVGGYRGGK
jgi:hypothetical protein